LKRTERKKRGWTKLKTNMITKEKRREKKTVLAHNVSLRKKQERGGYIRKV
jgi:hypothetical protein